MEAIDPQQGRMVAGRYRVGTRLGAGSDAASFEALDESLQRVVVVTLVHPELSSLPEVQQAFATTMETVAGLHHPNIAGVYEWGTARWGAHDVLYSVSERLTGGSLRDLLDRGRQLSPSQALLVGLDACKALDVVHRKGLVHTDVRPSTLVFGDDLRLRLVDVGLAQVLAKAKSGSAADRSIDHAKYCAPEQAKGEPPQAKSDVYSLCLTLLEAVTGTLPFVGDSAVATLANRIDRLMPVSADLGHLAAVLERAGRPDPADRSSAAEFGRALMQTAEKLPRPAPLPIRTASLFDLEGTGADRGVDPTGPIRRPPVPVADGAPPVPEPAPEPAPELAPEVVLAPPSADDLHLIESLGENLVEPPVEAPVEPGVEPMAEAVPTEPIEPIEPIELVEPVEIVEPVEPVEPVQPVAVATGLPAPGPPPPHPFVDDEFEAEPGNRLRRSTDVAGSDHGVGSDGSEEGSGRSWLRRVLLVALLVLMASVGGVLAWYQTRPARHDVPSLAGMEEGVALNEIAGSFDPVVLRESSETVPVGRVIRTDPDAGTRHEEGTDVQLFISSGPAPRVLPELVGLTVAKARAVLEELGLVMEEGTPVPDEDAPPGVVVSWLVPASPTLVADGTVVKGTAVRVIASAGPAARTVPDLSGVPLAAATASLESLGLVIAQAPDEFSTTVPAGQVIRQDPAPGAAADRGATVTVVLSKGADLVTIPDLTSVAPTPAALGAALRGAGFTIGVIEGNSTYAFIGLRVAGHQAYTGERYVRGTVVDLIYSTI